MGLSGTSEKVARVRYDFLLLDATISYTSIWKIPDFPIIILETQRVYDAVGSIDESSNKTLISLIAALAHRFGAVVSVNLDAFLIIPAGEVEPESLFCVCLTDRRLDRAGWWTKV